MTPARNRGRDELSLPHLNHGKVNSSRCFHRGGTQVGYTTIGC